MAAHRAAAAFSGQVPSGRAALPSSQQALADRPTRTAVLAQVFTANQLADGRPPSPAICDRRLFALTAPPACPARITRPLLQRQAARAVAYTTMARCAFSGSSLIGSVAVASRCGCARHARKTGTLNSGCVLIPIPDGGSLVAPMIRVGAAIQQAFPMSQPGFPR